MMKTFNWTEESESALRKLYAEGFSSSQIAVQLGCPSRNAVIGKVHRLGIVRPVKVSKPAPVKVVAEAKAVKRQALHPSKAVNQPARREHFQSIADKALENFDERMPQSLAPVRFLEYGRLQCAAPQRGWDLLPATEKMVCGQPVQAGTSWCPACLAVVSPTPKFAAFKHRKLVGGIAA